MASKTTTIIIAVVAVVAAAILFWYFVLRAKATPPPPTTTITTSPTPITTTTTTSPTTTSATGISIPPGAQYAVDYNYYGVFACQPYTCGSPTEAIICNAANVASQVKSALQQYTSQIVGYVVWDGCFDGHITVFFASQPSSTLVSGIGSALNSSLPVPYYNVDYNGPVSGMNFSTVQNVYAVYPSTTTSIV